MKFNYENIIGAKLITIFLPKIFKIESSVDPWKYYFSEKCHFDKKINDYNLENICVIKFIKDIIKKKY